MCPLIPKTHYIPLVGAFAMTRQRPGKRILTFLFLIHCLCCNLYAMKTEQTITLPDGRSLGFAEYGDPSGFPVFYFHGGQESRLSSAFMDPIARELQLRIIAPDRPGIGLSSFQEGRTLLDWGKDMADLADALGIGTFSVFGLSGGGPHVLACTLGFPDRIVKASIVSGTGPHNYKGKLRGVWFPVKLMHWFAAGKNDKNLRKFIAREHKTLSEKPQKRLRQLQKFLPKPDRVLLTDNPTYGIEFIKASQEAYRQGMEAAVQEWKLYVSDWGFSLRDIQKHIVLWYGGKDKMAPKHRGTYLHQMLPNSTFHLMPNEGHFSLIRNHLREILGGLRPLH